MIRFSCPMCRSVLEVAETKGGSKVPCPKCGQRLQVPSPPALQNKTVLAPLVAHKPDTVAGPPPVPPPLSAALQPTPPSAQPPPVPLPSPTAPSARRHTPTRYLVPAGVAVAAVVIAIIALIVGTGRSKHAFDPGTTAPLVSTAKHDGEPRTGPEKTLARHIKKYIEEYMPNVNAIQWRAWGPSVPSAKVQEVLQKYADKEAGMKPFMQTFTHNLEQAKKADWFIRVRFKHRTKDTWTISDSVYGVSEEGFYELVHGGGEDNWFEEWARRQKGHAQMMELIPRDPE